MTFSTWVPVLNGADRLPKLLSQLRRISDEVIVLIDRKTTDPSYDVARKYADAVYFFDHDDKWLNMYLAAFEYCTSDWLMDVADDETLSTEWDLDLVKRLVSERSVTHYFIPTRTLLGVASEYVVNGPWYPLWMAPRIYRNIPSLARWGSGPHSIFDFAGEAAYLAGPHIDHWKTLIRTRDEREERVKLYELLEPGWPENRYDLIEDFYVETDDLVDQPPGSLWRKLSADSVAKGAHSIDCFILDARNAMTVDESYGVRLLIRNRTGRKLPATSRYLHDSPIWLSSHWIKLHDSAGTYTDNAARQVPFPATLGPGEEMTFLVRVRAPSEPGVYDLKFDLVEQGVAWFSQTPHAGQYRAATINVQLRPPGEWPAAYPV